ncbi:hypothetical protein V8C86DRAFT_2867342 [Haematococcus lacustris]
MHCACRCCRRPRVRCDGLGHWVSVRRLRGLLAAEAAVAAQGQAGVLGGGAEHCPGGSGEGGAGGAGGGGGEEGGPGVRAGQQQQGAGCAVLLKAPNSLLHSPRSAHQPVLHRLPSPIARSSSAGLTVTESTMVAFRRDCHQLAPPSGTLAVAAPGQGAGGELAGGAADLACQRCLLLLVVSDQQRHLAPQLLQLLPSIDGIPVPLLNLQQPTLQCEVLGGVALLQLSL